MDIKRIKNLKYSASKSKEAALLSELKSELNTMLLESDWTQLEDVSLTTHSRYKWRMWRNKVRTLKRSDGMSSSELRDSIATLNAEKNIGLTDREQFLTIEDGREYLYGLLISKHLNRLNSKFSPTLETKYQEVLDIITVYLAENKLSIPSQSLDTEKLIEYIEGLPLMEMDISGFPFFKLLMGMKNLTINETIVYVLKNKLDQFKFMLSEERNLIHYERKISTCYVIDEIPDIKMEIELNYER